MQSIANIRKTARFSLVRSSAAGAVLFLGSIAASAQPRDFPIGPVNQDISGVAVSFSGTLSVRPMEGQCNSLNAVLVIDLQDFLAKATQIVRASGVEKNEGCGDRVAISGTHVERSGNGFRIKVDGNVGRQQCVKTKVPEVHGLEVKMVMKIVGSTTVDTNASIVAVFAPVVENGKTLRLNRVGGIDVNVSNDALRSLLSATELDKRLVSHIESTVDKALAGDKARLALPDALNGLEIHLKDAKIVDGASSLALNVEGDFAIPFGKGKLVYSLMGFPTDGC
ncbi:hypothetical protein [Rhizobium leguminosarum]|uniref:hypothetical protein n=1 Tax=Rhizobium leguminosarum TaxID=384 RepID=UPI000485D650|nr:hypothetical protein [Rhizobium leguminosarum]